MAKRFIVRCYYEYVARVEVEADSYEEAFDKAFPICEGMATEELTYVGGVNAEVECDNVIEQYTI